VDSEGENELENSPTRGRPSSIEEDQKTGKRAGMDMRKRTRVLARTSESSRVVLMWSDFSANEKRGTLRATESTRALKSEKYIYFPPPGTTTEKGGEKGLREEQTLEEGTSALHRGKKTASK